MLSALTGSSFALDAAVSLRAAASWDRSKEGLSASLLEGGGGGGGGLTLVPLFDAEDFSARLLLSPRRLLLGATDLTLRLKVDVIRREADLRLLTGAVCSPSIPPLSLLETSNPPLSSLSFLASLPLPSSLLELLSLLLILSSDGFKFLLSVADVNRLGLDEERADLVVVDDDTAKAVVEEGALGASDLLLLETPTTSGNPPLEGGDLEESSVALTLREDRDREEERVLAMFWGSSNSLLLLLLFILSFFSGPLSLPFVGAGVGASTCLWLRLLC